MTTHHVHNHTKHVGWCGASMADPADGEFDMDGAPTSPTSAASASMEALPPTLAQPPQPSRKRDRSSSEYVIEMDRLFETMFGSILEESEQLFAAMPIPEEYQGKTHVFNTAHHPYTALRFQLRRLGWYKNARQWARSLDTSVNNQRVSESVKLLEDDFNNVLKSTESQTFAGAQHAEDIRQRILNLKRTACTRDKMRILRAKAQGVDLPETQSTVCGKDPQLAADRIPIPTESTVGDDREIAMVIGILLYQLFIRTEFTQTEREQFTREWLVKFRPEYIGPRQDAMWNAIDATYSVISLDDTSTHEKFVNDFASFQTAMERWGPPNISSKTLSSILNSAIQSDGRWKEIVDNWVPPE